LLLLLTAARLFIAASFLLAGIEDVKERAVYDYVWFPGLFGVALAVYTAYTSMPTLLFYADLIKLLMMGGMGIAIILVGRTGQADAIALLVISSDPSLLSFSSYFFAGGAIAVAVVYLRWRGYLDKVITIPYEQFVNEKRWIPLAIVDETGKVTELTRDVNVSRESALQLGRPGTLVNVQYGFPLVAYYAIGWFAYLAFALALGAF
jgi:hypothetical protein